MKKMFLLFSHKLSNEQMIDAQNTFGVAKFISLPLQLQKLWKNFNPDIKKLTLEDFKSFLSQNANQGDVVLIQGDFGATFAMVNFALESGLVPVYATTQREVVEVVEDGQTVKKSIFKHRRFRRYE